MGYIATVQMGTPPRDFKLLMDSGSADLWVGAEQCQSEDGGDCVSFYSGITIRPTVCTRAKIRLLILDRDRVTTSSSAPRAPPVSSTPSNNSRSPMALEPFLVIL